MSRRRMRQYLGNTSITIWAVLLVLAAGRLISPNRRHRVDPRLGRRFNRRCDPQGHGGRYQYRHRSEVQSHHHLGRRLHRAQPHPRSVQRPCRGSRLRQGGGHRRHPGCRSTGTRQPSPQAWRRDRDGYGCRGCCPTRYRQCRDFATCQFAAGDRVAAQRAQFLRSALYRSRRGRDRRRTVGSSRRGRGHQHQRIPAGVEQLPARRHPQHRSDGQRPV